MAHPENRHLTAHRDLMFALKKRLSTIADTIGSEDIDYLGIPMHENIGDLLIYLGSLAFFDDKKIKIKQTTSHLNFFQGEPAASHPIVLHGGGNLGDLYPREQAFKEKIIRSNLNRRIVILPQTIHFKHKINQEKTEEILSSHKDLHIFVRDKESLALASRLTPNTYLSPDMAHYLYPVIPTATARSSPDTLFILRRDIEDSHTEIAPEFSQIIDWQDCVPWQHLVTRKAVTSALSRLPSTAAKHTHYSVQRWWKHRCNALAQAAINILSGKSLIVTNRLHGHILSCLLNIPSKVYDNSYGKNFSYIKVWTLASPLTEIVTIRPSLEGQ